jgi:hypothetical protein
MTKVAVVTGSSSGIGYETSLLLARNHQDVNLVLIHSISIIFVTSNSLGVHGATYHSSLSFSNILQLNVKLTSVWNLLTQIAI